MVWSGLISRRLPNYNSNYNLIITRGGKRGQKVNVSVCSALTPFTTFIISTDWVKYPDSLCYCLHNKSFFIRNKSFFTRNKSFFFIRTKSRLFMLCVIVNFYFWLTNYNLITTKGKIFITWRVKYSQILQQKTDCIYFRRGG